MTVSRPEGQAISHDGASRVTPGTTARAIAPIGAWERCTSCPASARQGRSEPL